MIIAIAQFYLKIKTNQLVPDKDRDTTLCMTQYGRVLGSMRIPKTGRDQLLTFADAKHIVVMKGGQFWRVQILDSNNRIIPKEALNTSLKEVIRQSKSNSSLPIGLLTTQDRDLWANQYSAILQENEVNQQIFSDLNSSIFFVCLDDESPTSMQQLSQLMLHSDGTNRWFDKCLQLIVTKNAKAGINVEHSGVDGHTLLRYEYL